MTRLVLLVFTVVLGLGPTPRLVTEVGGVRLGPNLCSDPDCHCTRTDSTWSSLNCVCSVHQLLELSTEDVPATVLKVTIRKCQQVVVKENAFTNKSYLVSVIFQDIGKLILDTHAFDKMDSSVALSINISDVNEVTINKYAFKNNMNSIAIALTACGHVMLGSYPFSWLQAFHATKVSSLDLSPYSFHFDFSSVPYTEPTTVITIQYTYMESIPDSAFPSATEIILIAHSKVGTIQYLAFSSNTIKSITLYNSTVTSMQSLAFSEKTLVDNMEFNQVHFRSVSPNAVKSAVSNFSMVSCSVIMLPQGSINTSVATVTISGNQFDTIGAHAFALRLWNKVSFDNNTIANLKKHAFSSIKNPDETMSPKFEIEGNIIENPEPECLVVENLSQVFLEINGNIFAKECRCEPANWISEMTKNYERNSVRQENSFKQSEEIIKNNFCTIGASFIECLNIDGHYISMRNFSDTYCFNGKVNNTCATVLGTVPVKNGSTAAMEWNITSSKGILLVIFLTVVASTAVIFLLLIVLWIRKKKACIIVGAATENLLTCSPLLSSSETFSGSITRISVHEHIYAEIQTPNSTKEESFSYELQDRFNITGKGAYNDETGQDSKTDVEDKATQTLPDDFAEEILVLLKQKLDDPAIILLKQKLDDPANYSQVRDAKEHLYDLIKVEDPDPPKPMPNPLPILNDYAQPKDLLEEIYDSLKLYSKPTTDLPVRNSNDLSSKSSSNPQRSQNNSERLRHINTPLSERINSLYSIMNSRQWATKPQLQNQKTPAVKSNDDKQQSEGTTIQQTSEPPQLAATQLEPVANMIKNEPTISSTSQLTASNTKPPELDLPSTNTTPSNAKTQTSLRNPFARFQPFRNVLTPLAMKSPSTTTSAQSDCDVSKKQTSLKPHSTETNQKQEKSKLDTQPAGEASVHAESISSKISEPCSEGKEETVEQSGPGDGKEESVEPKKKARAQWSRFGSIGLSKMPLEEPEVVPKPEPLISGGSDVKAERRRLWGAPNASVLNILKAAKVFDLTYTKDKGMKANKKDCEGVTERGKKDECLPKSTVNNVISTGTYTKCKSPETQGDKITKGSSEQSSPDTGKVNTDTYKIKSKTPGQATCDDHAAKTVSDNSASSPQQNTSNPASCRNGMVRNEITETQSSENEKVPKQNSSRFPLSFPMTHRSTVSPNIGPNSQPTSPTKERFASPSRKPSDQSQPIAKRTDRSLFPVKPTEKSVPVKRPTSLNLKKNDKPISPSRQPSGGSPTSPTFTNKQPETPVSPAKSNVKPSSFYRRPSERLLSPTRASAAGKQQPDKPVSVTKFHSEKPTASTKSSGTSLSPIKESTSKTRSPTEERKESLVSNRINALTSSNSPQQDKNSSNDAANKVCGSSNKPESNVSFSANKKGSEQSDTNGNLKTDDNKKSKASKINSSVSPIKRMNSDLSAKSNRKVSTSVDKPSYMIHQKTKSGSPLVTEYTDPKDNHVHVYSEVPAKKKASKISGPTVGAKVASQVTSQNKQDNNSENARSSRTRGGNTSDDPNSRKSKSSSPILCEYADPKDTEVHIYTEVKSKLKPSSGSKV